MKMENFNKAIELKEQIDKYERQLGYWVKSKSFCFVDVSIRLNDGNCQSVYTESADMFKSIREMYIIYYKEKLHNLTQQFERL